MIITSRKALDLIRRPNILEVLPELQGVVEAFNETNARRARETCLDCDRSRIFNAVETMALKAIAELPPDAVVRLKRFVGQNDLYVNLVQPGKPPSTKAL